MALANGSNQTNRHFCQWSHLKLLSEFFPFRPGDEAMCKENEILKHSGYRRLKMTPWWNRPVLRTAILPVVFSCVNNWGKLVCTSLTLSNLKKAVDTCLSFKMWFCNLTSSFSGDVGLGLFGGWGIVLHNVCFDSNNRGKNLHDLRYSTKLLTSQKPDFSCMFNWENIIPLRLHSTLRYDL